MQNQNTKIDLANLSEEFQEKMKNLDNEVLKDVITIVGGTTDKSAPYSKIHASGGFTKDL
ncbi:hypothetical protein G7092_18555 [Mucilaginibacter sp. HC2]|jgi:hypothetical protein|uniref:hypothetical protein n=1 Tax=Mucilaginibacter inviolabilis TaxID=2714892 RepID=UPI00140DFF22|nr:hypothetical protein [Mucilaginibacter inviolabilis]NHA05820.1 hypothetical protein [Mucilaginibacter inviolabilis]